MSAQLGSFALQGRSFALERTRGLRAPLQDLFEVADCRALRCQPAAHIVLMPRARPELALHGRQVALGRRAFGGRGLALPLRLRGAPLSLGALFNRGLTPLPGIAEPLRRQPEVAVQPADFELPVGETA